MFRIVIVQNFYENARGGDHSYSAVQLAAWTVTEDRLHQRYFPVNFLKLLRTPTLPVRQLFSATC